MKPLLKVEMKNLPLSIPVEWVDFFDAHAAALGVSRNAVFRLALKFGGPVLQRICEVARDGLKDSLASPAFDSYEIVVSPARSPLYATTLHDERRQSDSHARPGSPEKPGGSKKINRGARGEKARADRHTGQGNSRHPGSNSPRPGDGKPGKRA